MDYGICNFRLSADKTHFIAIYIVRLINLNGVMFLLLFANQGICVLKMIHSFGKLMFSMMTEIKFMS